MKRMFRFALFLLLAMFITAGQSVAETLDGAGVWNMLSLPAIDSTKFAVTENVEIARDRIHITLVNGSIEFTTSWISVSLFRDALLTASANSTSRATTRSERHPPVVTHQPAPCRLPWNTPSVSFGSLRAHGRLGKQGQPLWLSPRPAEFHFFKEQ
jgi:hypothetical protein